MAPAHDPPRASRSHELAIRDVAVIADDLTGAADCGIAFAVAGLPTFVTFGEKPAPDSARIVAIDTDSRWRSETEAKQRALEAARGAYREGTRTIYKKIDSTLRGHVGAELAATFQAASERRSGAVPIVLLAPAFPAMGRMTRGGRILVGGVPLEETEVWRKSGMSGPADPVPLLRQAGLRAAAIDLARVRSGAEPLAESMADEMVQAAVCDAEVEDDLRRVAEAGARLRRPVVWAGSGGLARHLPAALGLEPDPAQKAPPLDRASGPVLMLVGSRSQEAHEQARFVAAQPGVRIFELAPDQLLLGERSPAASQLERALAERTDVVLVISLGERVDLSLAASLAAALARLAAGQASRIGGLVATGGDIARAALAALGAAGLHLLGEVEPGVPIGLADTHPALPVVTKAGAFGTPPTLQRSRAALKRLYGGS